MIRALVIDEGHWWFFLFLIKLIIKYKVHLYQTSLYEKVMKFSYAVGF